MIKADLHIHTCYSDGKFTPEEILKTAKSKGLGILSVTDHDNFEGSAKMLEYNGKQDIRIIPGIEISADFRGKETHILGYFLDFTNKALIQHLDFIKNLRLRRFQKIISKLLELGVSINPDNLLKKYSESNSIGRPHIANELVEQGLVSSYSLAFHRYLGDNKPADVKKENLDHTVIIELIHKAGGLAFLAHPSNYFRESTILKLREAGIDGIETVHPSHTSNQTDKFTTFAKEHNLLTCGGSDFHGYYEEDFSNIGKYCVGEETVLRMKEKIN
ncbi:MAG: PHP domain-containing protein [Bacteroidetes bacterium]|nr:PHP domain-containing protein [Bacteroidota bacterium]